MIGMPAIQDQNIFIIKQSSISQDKKIIRQTLKCIHLAADQDTLSLLQPDLSGSMLQKAL